MRALLAAALATLLLAAGARADTPLRAGAPDLSFGGDATLALSLFNDDRRAIAADERGGLVVAGGRDGAVSVVHLGASGAVTWRRRISRPGADGNATVLGIVVRRDGRVVVVAQERTDLLMLVGLTARGSLDRSFGDAGYVERALGDALQVVPSTPVAQPLVDPDGILYVALWGPRPLVLAFDAKGRPARRFGGGAVEIPSSFGFGNELSLLLEPDGRIGLYGGAHAAISLTGEVSARVSRPALAWAGAPIADGSGVIVPVDSPTVPGQVRLARLNAFGAPARRFGTDGIAAPLGRDVRSLTVARAPSGATVVAGTVASGSSADTIVAAEHLRPDGTHDPRFARGAVRLRREVVRVLHTVVDARGRTVALGVSSLDDIRADYQIFGLELVRFRARAPLARLAGERVRASRDGHVRLVVRCLVKARCRGTVRVGDVSRGFSIAGRRRAGVRLAVGTSRRTRRAPVTIEVRAGGLRDSVGETLRVRPA